MSEKVVYAIKHNKTNRIYIGSSERVCWRIKDHLKLLRTGKHKNELMQSDFNDFGEDYSFYALDVVPTQWFKEREYYWMLYFETYNKEKGYNYKDRAMARRDIKYFPEIDMEITEPVKNRDMLTCFERTAKYLGYGLDELMALKKEKSD